MAQFNVSVKALFNGNESGTSVSVVVNDKGSDTIAKKPSPIYTKPQSSKHNSSLGKMDLEM